MAEIMSFAKIRALACLAPLIVLSACAARSDYPSLARRPAERIEGRAEPASAETAAPAPVAPPSADFTTRLDQLVQQARAAHARFTERQGAAERTIGSGGGAIGSEGWASASVALSGLESARSEAMIALGTLDEIYTAEAVASAETGDPARRDAASAAHDQVESLVAEEDAVLERLRAKVR